MDYRVIKENDLFLLTNESGNIPTDHPYGLGLYTKDTRFLSQYSMKINGMDPILLSSDANENYVSTLLLTNPHIENDGEVELWRESIEIMRKRFIFDGVLYENIVVKNYNPQTVTFQLSLHMDADFKDMFIVRGFQHGEVGSISEYMADDHSLSIAYEGADSIKRKTKVMWDKKPSKVHQAGDIHFDFTLSHSESESIQLTVCPITGNENVQPINPEQALSQLESSYQSWDESTTKVTTDNSELQNLLDRSLKDLRVLLNDIGYGSFPVAGLPWFGVPFGRDSLITALQMLPYEPKVAKGTLKTMAAFQGENHDQWRDEQPGKIMHELRKGELANTNQVPFTPYYGSIDSTPLFLVLLADYVKWTKDIDTFKELLPNVKAALTWIDEYGDRDGDGFVEYHQESSKGIANQGWKDSADSVVHRDGTFAQSPIALAEVQGYVYQAKTEIARLFRYQNDEETANRLEKEAALLKENFNRAFWMEDVQFFAIALDKDKKQVGTITSNPGHLLLTGILDTDKAHLVSEKLVSPSMFSGYGIRTMGEGEAAYNPMSYHDGSVWPHDNSLVILGMSKTKNIDPFNKVIEGLMDASRSFEYHRLPELFCGYDNGRGKPIKYPVACSPQAWAAGTPLTFIQSMLGLFPDSLSGHISLNVALPDSLNSILIEDLSIAGGVLSLRAEKAEGKNNVHILQNTTGLEIIINN
ncbi:amylo-alpha-1,6-glucosidase [Pseudalkalibacillus sp. SCS-8]|uniref:amylo-alpha-1,6-glucosidase n=1 Tax=Pseudalkalibacillus nanhaiensis TaxID=3115291 RepID=UPI0032DAE15F